jgi:transcriptional regulator with XRE-family HTH domain
MKAQDYRSIVAASMKERGLSQTALAAASDIPQPNISAYLAGKSDLNGDTLARLCAALNLKLRA